MNNNIQQFFYWIDRTSEAEQRKDIKQMKRYLKKAEEVPIVNEFQKWVLNYSKAVFQLLYGAETERGAASECLVTLHDQAKDSPEIYMLVHELYIRLIFHVLQKNYTGMERFPRYEELAGELVGLVEQEERDEVDCQDLYSFSYSVQGMYYGRTGKIVLGEQCYRKVWNRVRTMENISGYAFCSLVYFANDLIFMGNVQEAKEVCTYLWEKLSGGSVRQLFQPDVNRFVSTFCYCLQCLGEDEKSLEILEAGFERQLLHICGSGDNMDLVYGNYLYELLEHHKSCPAQRQKEITKYLRKSEKDPSFKNLTAWQRSGFLRVCYYMEKICGGKNALCYLDKCAQILMTERFDEVDRIPFLNSMLHVIREYRNMGLEEKLVSCVDALMRKILDFYSDAEYFLDNRKMERYLEICKYSFEFCYLNIRSVVSKEKLFEFVLNEKNLLSSAIRYRNGLDKAELLRRKEQQQVFTFYKRDQMKALVPPHTAVIEFFWLDRINVLDVFVFAKEKSDTTILYHQINADLELRQQMSDWSECMHGNQGKNEKRSSDIYNRILKPVEQLLCHKKHIWICPHQELCNLSFEMILELAGQKWEYEDMVYWQSLRDIFIKWEDGASVPQTVSGDAGKDQLPIVIGNPLFFVNSGFFEQGSSEMQMILEQMKPLPFSAYEAKKVAQLTGGLCYLEEKSSKYSLKSGCSYLHIATHGILHLSGQNPWYQSKLAFSGAGDYIVSGKTCEEYGDGFLSAEEISRMTLTGTELVVLSVCNSGNSRFTDFGQQTGIHVAFGAAGVRYVISALWEVDDFATSIFMNFFYQNIRKKVCVPQALALARTRLKEITVKELLEILEDDQMLLDSQLVHVMERLRELPDGYCMYHSPLYWGSFVCYQYCR